MLTLWVCDFIQAHKEECPNAPVKCSLNCGLRIPRDELLSHVNSQCPKRPADCSHCGETLPWDSLEVRGGVEGNVEHVLHHNNIVFCVHECIPLTKVARHNLTPWVICIML